MEFPVELAVKDAAEILCLVFWLNGSVVQLDRGVPAFSKRKCCLDGFCFIIFELPFS
jgi:hypothetical protein